MAEQHRAVRFSLDEWVMQLFGSEAPHPMRFEWWAERCERCRQRIWSLCEALLARDVDVILDFGLPSLAQREQWRALALQRGAAVHLHVVTADPALRWQRVQTRNAGVVDTPMITLKHALLSLRDRPEHEKAAWRELFDYYVFGDPQQAASHLPEHMQGPLGRMDDVRARRLRADILARLNR